MQINLEDEDIQKIAARAAAEVVKAIEPLIAKTGPQEDPLLTVEDCAAYLHVSTAWIYKRTALKEIPFKKLGRLVMFRRSEVDAWIERSGKMPQFYDLSARLRVAE